MRGTLAHMVAAPARVLPVCRKTPLVARYISGKVALVRSEKPEQ